MSSLTTEPSQGVLHLITQIASTERLIEYGETYLADHHTVVLMEEAVYRTEAYLQAGLVKLRTRFSGELFLLEEDCLARGLCVSLIATPEREGVKPPQLIDYAGLVDLTVQYQAIRSLALD